METLAPDVPEHWEDRPDAPKFHFDLGSHGQERFVTIRQFDGSSIGGLRFLFRHGAKSSELMKPDQRSADTWNLGSFITELKGEPFEVELRFWWQGAERTFTRHWPTEAQFQSADWEDLYA